MICAEKRAVIQQPVVGRAQAGDHCRVVRPRDGWIDRLHSLCRGTSGGKFPEGGYWQLGIVQIVGWEAVQADDDNHPVFRRYTLLRPTDQAGEGNAREQQQGCFEFFHDRFHRYSFNQPFDSNGTLSVKIGSRPPQRIAERLSFPLTRIL